MLVIKRKVGESVTFTTADGTIVVTVVRFQWGKVDLSVDAPRCISVIRSELLEAKQDATRNVQARLAGSHRWTDYGDVSRDSAAHSEATASAIQSSAPIYTWIIEVQIEGDDTSRAVARVQTFVGADVLSFESAEAPYRE